MRTFQHRSESRGSRNPQTSAKLFGIDPGPNNGVGPVSVGNAQSAKALLMLSLLLRNQVNLLTNHDGTDCEDEHFRNTPFLA